MEKLDESHYQYREVKELLGEEEFTNFLQFVENNPNQPESIRINSLRYDVEEYKKLAQTYDVSFSPVQGNIKDAFYVSLPEKTRDWWNQERLLGKFYSQGNASMIPPLYLFNEGDDFNSLKVFDMCAAPGSKTTQIGAMMKNKGLLVANDFKSHRLYSLHRNLQVFGIANAVVTQMDGRWLGKRWEKTFDRVLLDAPCSGTGSNRNNLFSNRNEEALVRFQGKQKSLLASAIATLKDKESVLIYSTCSFLPIENELVIQPFIDKGLVEIEKISLDGWKTQPGLTSWKEQELSSQFKNALRINPQDNDSDAFFIAKLKLVSEKQ